ncbi:MAG: serine hydrolase [Myxococcota bacterium]
MLLDRDGLRRVLAGHPMHDELGVRIELDEARGRVSLHKEGLRPAHARFTGDQGVVLVADPDAPVHFDPEPAPPQGPDPDATPWPTGDRTPGDLLDRATSDTLDPAVAERAADLVFANPAQCASAFLVVHRGQIVAERYFRAYDRETRFEAWSMGKTIGLALAGRSLALHGGDLDQTDLFPEWAHDERRHIRLRDLMQLSSGLAFSGSFGRNEDQSELARDGRFLDHVYVYASGGDAFRFCVDAPLEHPPGTVGRYRNCDPLLLQKWLRDRLIERGESPLAWPQRALFDPLGIRGIVLETDPFGQFLISGHDYGRARDFARLGLLFLQDGTWNGQPVLPEGFVDFVRRPAPAWKGERGASVVLNRDGRLALPTDAYWMSGATVNRTIVVPSLDLVVVRMGPIAGRPAGELATLNEALALIADAAGR